MNKTLIKKVTHAINITDSDVFDKAVKDYQCVACDLTIFKGEYLVRRTDKTVRHPNCLRIAKDKDRKFDYDRAFDSIAQAETENRLTQSISYFEARPEAQIETAVKMAVSKVRKGGWVYGYDVNDLIQSIYCKLYEIDLHHYPFEYIVVCAHNAAEDFRRKITRENREVPTDLSDDSITTTREYSGKVKIKLLLKEYLLDGLALPLELRISAEYIYNKLSKAELLALDVFVSGDQVTKSQQKCLERIQSKYVSLV